jgi:hypothetical protein
MHRFSADFLGTGLPPEEQNSHETTPQQLLRYSIMVDHPA